MCSKRIKWKKNERENNCKDKEKAIKRAGWRQKAEKPERKDKPSHPPSPSKSSEPAGGNQVKAGIWSRRGTWCDRCVNKEDEKRKCSSKKKKTKKKNCDTKPVEIRAGIRWEEWDCRSGRDAVNPLQSQYAVCHSAWFLEVFFCSVLKRGEIRTSFPVIHTHCTKTQTVFIRQNPLVECTQELREGESMYISLTEGDDCVRMLVRR